MSNEPDPSPGVEIKSPSHGKPGGTEITWETPAADPCW
jgi:hypothetical protein